MSFSHNYPTALDNLLMHFRSCNKSNQFMAKLKQPPLKGKPNYLIINLSKVLYKKKTTVCFELSLHFRQYTKHPLEDAFGCPIDVQ